ncbi:Nuclear nucleic acid-binding protein C1D [Trichinella zimbabwensis]|uniref:Nuclear nucleic acid-binding protein C1D n=1 Tax=Trichinella zimbabwensis TaxID=268475 RepID=A0A0V1HEK0_9BILA|nr:Nuclear nucleic acid-binding protein C1D [Trichinella zimbabwensis]
MSAELRNIETLEKLLGMVHGIKEMKNVMKMLKRVAFADRLNSSSPCGKIRFMLTMQWLMNALFACFMRSKGIDPTNSVLKQHLLRIKGRFESIKLIEGMHKRPTVNVGAFKRLLRNALWNPVSRPLKQISAGDDDAECSGIPKKIRKTEISEN